LALDSAGRGNPSLKVLVKIAAALNVSPAERFAR